MSEVYTSFDLLPRTAGANQQSNLPSSDYPSRASAAERDSAAVSREPQASALPSTAPKTETVELMRVEGSLKRTIAYMLAHGQTPQEIHGATGLSINQVGLIIRSKDVKDLCAEIISTEKDFDPKMLLRGLAADAINCLGDIVRNPLSRNEHKIAAAKEILSRNFGSTPVGSAPPEKLDPVVEYQNLLREHAALQKN